MENEKVNRIEKRILRKFNENVESFELNCQKGQTNSPLCTLIRQDSIQEFVSYVNRTNLSLTSTIKPDFYESNSFLLEKEPSLIEYASFYGSIQIIKYLLNNHVEFKPEIWPYAIHSNNAELITMFEGNKIYENCITESIKCHHNHITDYIKIIYMILVMQVNV